MKNVVICIPLYNAESTLSRTLDSLVKQDYSISKIKIFDNASTDNSREIVHEYSKKFPFIELHINEFNIGAENNFTKCIQAAEGDYCLIAHTDDIYDVKFVSKSVKALEEHPGAVASFCNAWEIDDKEKVLGSRFYPKEISKHEVTVLSAPDLYNLIFKYSNFITCPSVMVRSEVYRDNIKVWNGAQFKTSADLDVWLRLVEHGDLIAINEKLISYRVAEASYSFRIAKKRTSKHDLFLVLDFYKQRNSKLISASDYAFLHLKDQAIRTLNMIRTKVHTEVFPINTEFNLSLIFKKMFVSKWHFKMSLSIIGIYLFANVRKLIIWDKQ